MADDKGIINSIIDPIGDLISGRSDTTKTKEGDTTTITASSYVPIAVFAVIGITLAVIGSAKIASRTKSK